MNKYKKLGIEILLAWLIPFIVLAVIIPMIAPVDFSTEKSMMFVAVFSLMIALFIMLYVKDIAHSGHAILLLGFLTFIWSFIQLYGAFSLLGKEKWWTLSETEIGLYTFLGIIGMLGFLAGLSDIWGSKYFIRWNPFRKNNKGGSGRN